MVVSSAAQTPPGSEPALWWLRILAIAAVASLVAAIMVLIQTKDRPRQRSAIWVLVIFLIPIIGPLSYLIWETIRYRRNNPRPTKGRAETMAPETMAAEDVSELRRREAKDHDDDSGGGRA